MSLAMSDAHTPAYRSVPIWMYITLPDWCASYVCWMRMYRFAVAQCLHSAMRWSRTLSHIAHVFLYMLTRRWTRDEPLLQRGKHRKRDVSNTLASVTHIPNGHHIVSLYHIHERVLRTYSVNVAIDNRRTISSSYACLTLPAMLMAHNSAASKRQPKYSNWFVLIEIRECAIQFAEILIPYTAASTVTKYWQHGERQKAAAAATIDFHSYRTNGEFHSVRYEMGTVDDEICRDRRQIECDGHHQTVRTE